MLTSSKELRLDVGLDGKFSNYMFVDIEKIYKYFIDIRNSAGVKTFNDYNEWLMAQQGFRM